MTTAPLTLTPKTTIHTLLKEYPFLLDFLAGYHPEFKKLTNPVLRRTVGRMATLDAVAEQGNVPLNRLTDDIAGEVERQTGTRPPVADVADAKTMDPARLAELHSIVKDLHAGKSVEDVKPRFEELIADVEATEIAAMEQQLIEGGVPDTPRSNASATCTCRCSPTPWPTTSRSPCRPVTRWTPSSARTRRCCR